MLWLPQNIPQANSYLKSGEWQREDMVGTELRSKTLGIIGIGNVGSEAAKRAHAFEMRVIAHDPFVSEDYALRHMRLQYLTCNDRRSETMLSQEASERISI